MSSAEAVQRTFECCFCGANVPGDDPRFIRLLLRGPEDSSQELWGHARCVRRAVQPSVPLLLPEEYEDETSLCASARMAHIMGAWLRRWWPLLKALLVVAILAGVGWQFARILRSEALQEADHSRSPGQILWDQMREARPADLAASAALYLCGLGFSGFFWVWLLRAAGQPVGFAPGLRAYYLSHLGKYAPGKGLTLVMRMGLATEAGSRPGAAVLTAVYEVLTTMAAGALVAAVLAVCLMGNDRAMLWRIAALLLLAGLPILPGVFNFLVRRLSARLLPRGEQMMPGLGNRALLVGLVTTAAGWFFLGAGLEAVLQSVAPSGPAWSVHGWLRSTAFLAVAYVAGFLTPSPGGLGVREFLLQQFLAPSLGARAVVVALLLRLLWTVAEFAWGAVIWWLPRTGLRSQESGVSPENAQSPTSTVPSTTPDS